MNLKLTYKDLRALKIWDNFKKNDIETDFNNYLKILDCLISCQQAIVDSKIEIPRWKVYIDTFTTKTILHCNTIASLIKGTKITSKRFNKDLVVIDLPSINVLFRAQLECFLMFDFIYCQPKKEEEKEFRYCNWMYYSLKNRLKIPSNTVLIKNQQKNDSIEIEALKEKIQSSPIFNSISKGQQKDIIKNGHPRLFMAWATLMDRSKLNKKIFKGMYMFLSEYAHTGAHGLLNFQSQSIGYSKNHETGYLMLLFSKIILCLYIDRLIKLFKSAEIVYNSFTDIITDIEFYVQFTQRGFNSK